MRIWTPAKFVNPQPLTGWKTWFLGALSGLFTFGACVLLDWVMMPSRRPVFYSDAFAGLIAAGLTFSTLRYYFAQQQVTAARLRTIADVNHHVRNALYSITLSVHVRSDPELTRITREAVDRIDWVLREVLPLELPPNTTSPQAQEQAQGTMKPD